MILESNLLAKLDRRKNIKSWIKYLKEALATIFTKKVYVLEIVRSVAYGESEFKLFACKEIINRW
jgi:hypothetical protein